VRRQFDTVIAMRRGRFVQVSALVTLFLTGSVLAALFLASSAPASSRNGANQAARALVTSALIRAEIVTSNGAKVNDYRVYRGTVKRVKGRLLTLSERDRTSVRIKLSAATQIRIDGRNAQATSLRPRMRATVMRKGSAAASWLYVAKKLADKSGSAIKALMSPGGFVRAEVVSLTGSGLLDSRVDTGVIESVDSLSLTLSESDGAVVQMPLDSTTQVQVDNVVTDLTGLAAGMKATTIRHGDGAVSQIWATGKKPNKGQGGGKK
jgi:hypothetical protein